MSTAQPETTIQQAVETLHDEQHEIEIELNQLGLERLVFFSDAVYAIAITLLVIDLRLPPGSGELDNRELTKALFLMLPQFFSYVLSFLVIGSFWNNHHYKFRYIRRYDRRLITLNLLLLMSIAFIPFPTAVLGESGNATATILYACAIIVPSLLSALEWWYAVHSGLVMESTSQRIKRRQTVRPLLTALVFALSIPVALYDPLLGKLFWALLIPISFLLR
jgi:uncharacterized membrane protein